MPIYPKLPFQAVRPHVDHEAEGSNNLEESKKTDDSNWVDLEEESKRKYFKDDSVLIESAASILYRRKKKDEFEAQKKIPKGKDKTHVIYV